MENRKWPQRCRLFFHSRPHHKVDGCSHTCEGECAQNCDQKCGLPRDIPPKRLENEGVPPTKLATHGVKCSGPTVTREPTKVFRVCSETPPRQTPPSRAFVVLLLVPSETRMSAHLQHDTEMMCLRDKSRDSRSNKLTQKPDSTMIRPSR